MQTRNTFTGQIKFDTLKEEKRRRHSSTGTDRYGQLFFGLFDFYFSRRSSIESSISSIPAFVTRRQSVHEVILEESESSFARKSQSIMSIKSSYDV